MESFAPSILLTDTNRWDLSARLAIGLSRAGCKVYGICPGYGHALPKTRAVKRTFNYNPSQPLASLQNAIESVTPDLIVPCCDRSVAHLHQLYAEVQTKGETGEAISELILRSLGTAASYPIVSSRYALLAVAREEGVRTPHFAQISSSNGLFEWYEKEPRPFVLKVDGSWGGAGVRVIRYREELEPTWDYLTRMGRLARTVKRAFVNRDTFPLWAWWSPRNNPVIAQSWIAGRPANCTVFAWRGEVRALIGVDVICSDGQTGPARLVRVVDNPEMRSAAEKIASRLGISGFFGLDFMIEQESGAASLIEMNPRLTPPGYLRLGRGKDLIGSLCEAVSATSLPDIVPETQSETVCYDGVHCPSRNDSCEAYHPVVPIEEMDLRRELQNPYPDRTWLFRIFQRLNRPVHPQTFQSTTHSESVVVPILNRTFGSQPANQVAMPITPAGEVSEKQL